MLLDREALELQPSRMNIVARAVNLITQAHNSLSVVSNSTIFLFVIVFVILGLLLGFADSMDNTMINLGAVDPDNQQDPTLAENSSAEATLAKYRIDTGNMEIDPDDSEITTP